MMSVFEDGSTLALYRDRDRSCADIAKFSKKDSEAYRRLSTQAAAWLPMVASTLYAPPAPQGASFALLDKSREGREFWRFVQMSTHDVVCEYFEHDKVRMHFARIAGENLVSPDEKATGLGVFVFVGFLEAYGIGVPIGGSGRLTDALVACIRDSGGEVLANVAVARVLSRNGRATGVVTDTGEVCEARDAVIGAIHPHDLGRMVEGIDAGISRAAEATQVSPVACITVHAALKAPLRFRSGTPVQAVMNELLPTRYEQLRRSFDDLRYGGFSQYPLIGFGSLTAFDPSRVPEGRATLHAWDYVPYERPDGRSWDETKRDCAERMIEHMGRFMANLGRDDILQYHCDSPVDMERTSPSFRRGDLHGIATTTWQSGAHRPTPELGQYTVPGVERLYLVGPFQHPGGGVFGAGRATAMKLAADLKLDLTRAPRRALRRVVEFAMSRAMRLAARS
jgi:phytoene dehydrogenase-like protein